jgi:hypothetical protein
MAQRLALHFGTRVGPYEILSALGAGGMGEVYRARDTKLNRDVALKILPSKFADDDDRLARFRQEAQVLRGGLQLGLARQAGTQLIRPSMQRGDAAPAHFAYVTAPLA